MPVLISGFCTFISDKTGYLDMNSAMLAKVEKKKSFKDKLQEGTN